MSVVDIMNAEMSPFWGFSIADSTTEPNLSRLPLYHKMALKNKRSTLPSWCAPETIEVTAVVEEIDGEPPLELAYYQCIADPKAIFFPVNYAVPIAALQANLWARLHHLKHDGQDNKPRKTAQFVE
jgi:hypothetical protein